MHPTGTDPHATLTVKLSDADLCATLRRRQDGTRRLLGTDVFWGESVRYLVSSPQGATGLLLGLERRGLVERIPHQREAYLSWRLTPAGVDLGRDGTDWCSWCLERPVLGVAFGPQNFITKCVGIRCTECAADFLAEQAERETSSAEMALRLADMHEAHADNYRERIEALRAVT